MRPNIQPDLFPTIGKGQCRPKRRDFGIRFAQIGFCLRDRSAQFGQGVLCGPGVRPRRIGQGLRRGQFGCSRHYLRIQRCRFVPLRTQNLELGFFCGKVGREQFCRRAQFLGPRFCLTPTATLCLKPGRGDCYACCGILCLHPKWPQRIGPVDQGQAFTLRYRCRQFVKRGGFRPLGQTDLTGRFGMAVMAH